MIASLAVLASANAHRALFQRAISTRSILQFALTAVLAQTFARQVQSLLQSKTAVCAVQIRKGVYQIERI